MSNLVDFVGNDDFFLGGSMYSSLKESDIFLSLGRHVDMHFTPRKRSRVSVPCVFSADSFEPKKQPSIEVLPDECLFEIFRRLPGAQERSSCAGVSKRWLMLLSNICRDEFHENKTANEEGGIVGNGEELDNLEVENDGYLSRSLEGKKATDIRLAAMAVGAASRGGLGKLSIRGSNPVRGVTKVGLKAIARGCPSLKVLSLWNVPSIGDEGLNEIANECHLLEKLDLSHCPGITDKALFSVAQNCPNLTDITIESCSNIGNEGLQALGKHCSNLKSVSVGNCPLVGDQGIASLLSSTSCLLTKLKLQSLNITDVCLAVVGYYGREITDLVLSRLQCVTERGFWVMGNGHGLQKLKSLTVTSCQLTDVGIDAMGKGCPNLKQFSLRKCAFLSDNGLVSFAKAAMSIESLQLEECHRITQCGFFGLLVNCGAKLKALSLVRCFGIKDFSLGSSPISPCKSLRSLIISNCPGFGDASLALMGNICPQLQHLELSGLQGITDAGLLPVLENCENGLSKVNLSGCINLTDEVGQVLAQHHGWTLEVLNLDGCRMMGDASLVAIAESCLLLNDLDVSRCSITDFGVAALARANHLNLKILSISGCSSVSDKSMPFLVKLGEVLTGLNLKHCCGISTSIVERLVGKLWSCDILQ